MNITTEIKTRLQALMPNHIELIDDSHLHAGHAGNTGGGHYRLLIVSDLFETLSRLERQRKVQDLLQDLFGHAIHALSIRTFTNNEYQQQATEHMHN